MRKVQYINVGQIERYRTGSIQTFKLFVDGTEVCSCDVALVRGNFWLMNLRTEPGFRYEGYASRLLEYLKQDFGQLMVCAKAFGFGASYADNNLIKWYEKRGFERVTGNVLAY